MKWTGPFLADGPCIRVYDRQTSVPQERGGVYLRSLTTSCRQAANWWPGMEKKERRQIVHDLPPFVRRGVYTPNVAADYYPITDGIEEHRRENQFSTCMVLSARYQFVESSSSSTWRDVSGSQCMHAIPAILLHLSALETWFNNLRESPILHSVTLVKDLRRFTRFSPFCFRWTRKYIKLVYRLNRFVDRRHVLHRECAAMYEELFIEATNSRELCTSGSW